MKYSEFPYKRITVESQRELMNGWLQRFEDAACAEDQVAVILEIDATFREYASYSSMATVNFRRNTKDEAAKAEKEYYDSIGPEIQEVYNRFNIALTQSPFKGELVAKWGGTFLNKIEMQLKTFDPQIKDLLREEMKLQNEYSELIAGAEIEFDGDTYNLTGLGPFQVSENREVRKRSFSAKYKWFEQHSTELDELYDKLVKLRHRIAQELGFESFIELAYLRMGRSGYGPQEVAHFRKQIVDCVVPVVHTLYEQKKDILGLDQLYIYDDVIEFKEGNPTPKGTPDELVARAAEMYHELSEETGEFFDIMVNEELMDLVNRKGKMAGGFCAAFPSCERPYIFSNFNRTDGDVLVLTHEAGHAFQYYSSRKQPLVEYLWATAEAAEIHSMSMEFITWPWMHRFFEDEADRFRYKHLVGSLRFLPYGACVDHFQHWVFESPEATPLDRKKKWLELECIYMPDLDHDDMEFLKSGGTWQRQLHIYQCPFYYIDYTLAQTCAFQFWMKNEENPEQAWEDYYRLCQAGGSLDFTGLVELAGLKSPFEDGCLKEVVEKVNTWLESVDTSTL
jgi:M3 family oligoendopeptidase